MTWLSVIVPTFNGERYLQTALESVARQAASDIEIIVIDDGSTDKTRAVAAQYAERMRLVFIDAAHTGNWVANTNRALAQAQGHYLAFLHQDDLWLEARVAVLRDLTERFPDTDLWLSPAVFVDADGARRGVWRCPLPADLQAVPRQTILERLLVQNFVAMPAPMLRTDLCRRSGGLDETLWYTADWDLWLRMAAAGTVRYWPHPLTAFRVHGQSQTVAGSRGLGAWRGQQTQVLERHLATAGFSPAAGRRIRRLGEFSIQVNTVLAQLAGGQRGRFAALLPGFLRLGPVGWYRYWRDSRIGERVGARLHMLRAIRGSA